MSQEPDVGQSLLQITETDGGGWLECTATPLERSRSEGLKLSIHALVPQSHVEPRPMFYLKSCTVRRLRSSHAILRAETCRKKFSIIFANIVERPTTIGTVGMKTVRINEQSPHAYPSGCFHDLKQAALYNSKKSTNDLLDQVTLGYSTLLVECRLRDSVSRCSGMLSNSPPSQSDLSTSYNSVRGPIPMGHPHLIHQSRD